MKPKWTHDCDCCEYLGSMNTTTGSLDWYECTESAVARYGDDGPEYWSTPKYIVNNDKYLISTNIDGTRGIYEMLVLARFMLKINKP